MTSIASHRLLFTLPWLTVLTLEVADGLSERERLSTGTKWKPGRISWYSGWKGCMMDARYWSIVVGNKGRLTFTWLSGSVPIEQESIAQFWWIIWIPAKNKWFTALIVAKLSWKNKLKQNKKRLVSNLHDIYNIARNPAISAIRRGKSQTSNDLDGAKSFR